MMERTDNLQFLLDQFLRNTPDAESGCVCSNDGLPMQHSSNMDRDLAELVGAAASGVRNLNLKMAQQFGRGEVVINHTELERGFITICAAGPGALLVVFTGPDVQRGALGQLAWAMQKLIGQVHEYLAAPPRSA